MLDLKNEFVTVSINPATGIIEVVRSSKRIDSAADVDAAWGEVVSTFLGLNRRRFRLLVDLRAAAGRNDPAFEEAMARTRKEMLLGFERVAVLVQSILGKMQVERYAREDEHELTAFMDEATARAWLAAPLAT